MPVSESRFSAAPYLAELRPFQRASVEQVVDVLYRRKTGTRYLVADETGLGKSMVARGVIAAAIDDLQGNDEVERIDIVYICSNADVARQNVKRLDILGTKVNLSTRLSMLATATHQLNTPVTSVGKPVNLVSLTPRTSFPDRGWRTGTRDERSLLFLILRDELDLRGARATAAYRILRGTMDWTRFKEHTQWFERTLDDNASAGAPPLDQTVVSKFLELVRMPDGSGSSVLDRFTDLLDGTAGYTDVPGGFTAAADMVIALRRTLARAGVEALEPDLVILDEFQRFTDLLQDDLPVSELAQEMFNYSTARVLLLSATPYKPFDIDDLADGTDSPSKSSDGTHREQFLGTLDFLTKGQAEPHEGSRGIVKLLSEFRDAVTCGQDPTELRDRLRTELLRVMCRTERPSTAKSSMVKERRVPASAVTADDVSQFIKLTELAQHVGTRLPMDVWKSVPALVHFMDAYQLGRFVARDAEAPEVQRMLRGLRRLDHRAIESYESLPQQNPRLQTLIDQTTGLNWQQMLWMPPSQPYLRPAGPYASFQAQTMTKKLVFSQWSATPTAVASLLSHEASRRIARSETAEPRKITTTNENVSQRLQFSRRGSDLSAMASFIAFFPLPGLADRADPLASAGQNGDAADREKAEAQLAEQLASGLPTGARESTATESASVLWRWPLMIADGVLDEALAGTADGLMPAAAMAGRVHDPDDPEAPEHQEQTSALEDYVKQAASVRRGERHGDLTTIPPDLALRTAQLAMHSPANCAWRALGRLSVNTSQVTVAGRWCAAAVLASGLRTLFNRWESSLILDELYRDDIPYWQKVLRYCADGNLQAVLDEYLYHLAAVEGDSSMTDEKLARFAFHAAQPLKLSTAIYKGKDPLGGADIDFRCRFAMRYGDSKQEDQSVRSTDIREAFNSPFWPFVLVSTSVGQEGIDFHPWCHNLVHWNVPGNPVDFEQRDGRVNRFRGHAVRRNIAQKHGSEMLRSVNPWREAYELAGADAPHPDVPGLAPDWVYPGPHRVFRDVFPYQLSTDEARIERVKKRVAYYRLAFGQARQEDLISVVAATGVTADEATAWRVDLRPGAGLIDD
ncbi:helicase C-terminal domain-containing protein [Gordonia metallireducens]|uniref:helicase C-terminal domain-containing protein n=1 Tax=Gordonia metallireducens TaxID=2897779 RepID=UPI001E4179B8|nr:helicase C-terminal domain-containing protein [Gordonia metallireducens]